MNEDIYEVSVFSVTGMLNNMGSGWYNKFVTLYSKTVTDIYRKKVGLHMLTACISQVSAGLL